MGMVFKQIRTSLVAVGISVASLGAVYSPPTAAAAIPWFQVYAPTAMQAAGTDLAISYAQNPAGPPTFRGFPEYQVLVKPPGKPWVMIQNYNQDTYIGAGGIPVAISAVIRDVMPGTYHWVVYGLGQQQVAKHQWGQAEAIRGMFTVAAKTRVTVSAPVLITRPKTLIAITAHAFGLRHPWYQFRVATPMGHPLITRYSHSPILRFVPRTSGAYRITVYAKPALQSAAVASPVAPVMVGSLPNAPAATQVQIQHALTDPVWLGTLKWSLVDAQLVAQQIGNTSLPVPQLAPYAETLAYAGLQQNLSVVRMDTALARQPLTFKQAQWYQEATPRNITAVWSMGNAVPLTGYDTSPTFNIPVVYSTPKGLYSTPYEVALANKPADVKTYGINMLFGGELEVPN